MMSNKEFYYEDLVILTDDSLNRCSVGLVTKDKPFTPTFLKKSNLKSINSHDSKLEENNKESDEIVNSSSNESEDDTLSDGNLYDPPQKENVNVNWFIHKYISEINDLYDNTYIENIPGSNLHLYDRSLEMSDIVKLNIDGNMKVGTIFNVKMRADVFILGQNKVIKNVDCSRMKWIEPYMGKNLETNYTYDSWLGEVLEISIEVIVRFPDGARLKVPDTLLNQFDNKIAPVWNPEIILEGCVLEGDAQDFKSRKAKFLSETIKHNSKWLSKLKQEEIVQVLVEKIIPVSADMQWVFGYNNKNGVVPESPAHTLKGKELEKLEPVHPYPWHCLTVGDIWYYELAEDDKILELNADDNIENVIYKLINGQIDECTEYIPSNTENDEEQVTNKILDTQISSGFVMKPRKKILCNVKSRNKRKPLSIVNVRNGYSSDESADSNNIEPNLFTESKINNSIDHTSESVENLNILTKEALNRMKPHNLVPVGVLLTRCIVDVNWQDGTVTHNIPTSKLIQQMYSIDEHEFFPGDFVSQKFDPLNPTPEQTMHNFGTIISANSKDRVAKVQWFDYISNDLVNSSVIKAGEPEEIGVYDISALNEHHFVLGQEVIIKQEIAHKNYPAGYVTRLEPNDGLLVIRWPDGKELPMSPTDLLLTVESAIGGGSVSSDESGFDISDDLSSELHSDTDSTDWETVEEVEGNQSDELYVSKLMCASRGLKDLLDKVKKVEAIFSSVTEFARILHANLPLHMSQMINMKNIFKTEIELERPLDESSDISFIEQQGAFRTLFEIRQNISTIYKQCNDVGIKRMFDCYRPRDFLPYRNMKNFIVNYCKFGDYSKFDVSLIGSSDKNDELNGNLTEINHNLPNTEIPDDSAAAIKPISEENTITLVENSLTAQYKSIRNHLQYLQESIEVWLEEKSCYRESGTIEIGDSINMENDALEAPRVSLNGEEKMNGIVNDITVEPQPDCDQLPTLNPTLDEENSAQIISEDVKPETSDRTMSTCEPIPDEHRGQFILIESAPSSHKFINSPRPTFSNTKFSKAWKRDINLLSTSLPRGVTVKSFDDRVDLFSIMIVGPSGTPYQHALFFFDIQLGAQYPTEPPSVFYISLTSERVNPNLYTEGRVCLSLLGTWNGKGTENWDSKVSSLLQIIVSLQGLILVSEPYYNEAGFEIRKGSEEGKENSQRYNENAINNISQSMINLLHKSIPVFENEIIEHFQEFGNSLVGIHDFWSKLDEEYLKLNADKIVLPDFPLAPVSKGFHLSLQRNINSLKRTLFDKISEWQKPVSKD